jgi:hypothetical protein
VKQFYRKLPGKRFPAIRFTFWQWQGLGLKTWPVTHLGHQKRAIHFGFGYLTWRLR